MKKMSFSKEETGRAYEELDGYIWIILDIKKGIVVAGDDYVMDMKNALLKQKCSVYDIYGVGLDMETGEIDYHSQANIKVAVAQSSTDIPEEVRERVECLVRYFFEELPVFKREAERPRYSKKP